MIINKELARSTGTIDKDKWGTPDPFYLKLHKEFNFTLDPCCEIHTAKCKKFYTAKDNGLIYSWKGHSVFINPPYSKGNIDKWVAKCYRESYHAIVVALLPVSTSSNWFHNFIIGKCEIRFVNKRIRFKNAPSTAPFSSMVCVFGKEGLKSFNQ